jgi:hypothetical protein
MSRPEGGCCTIRTSYKIRRFVRYLLLYPLRNSFLLCPPSGTEWRNGCAKFKFCRVTSRTDGGRHGSCGPVSSWAQLQYLHTTYVVVCKYLLWTRRYYCFTGQLLPVAITVVNRIFRQEFISSMFFQTGNFLRNLRLLLPIVEIFKFKSFWISCILCTKLSFRLRPSKL